MYRVLCDGLPIYDLRDEELVLLDPKVTLEVNTAGSFDFKLPPGHPQYNLPQKMKSLVEVWHDDEQIFAGRPVEEKIDFYKRKYVKCEGQLAYLNDSIQRPAEYHDMTVRGYLETLIDNHNKQVDESKQFEVGIVTVTDNNDSLFRYTNYNNTLKEIKEDLLNDLGGYLRVRNHNGHRYIDYIAEFDNLCSQSIQFGENLLDYAKNIDVTDIATAIIPLGARLETSEIAALEEHLTIKSVNGGKDYLAHEDAVKKYGFIVKTVTWDNVTTPEMLKSKGQKWLIDGQFENMVLEVKAVDLHYTDEQIEQFKLFDVVLVHSAPHGLDKRFPLSKMTIHLDKPASNTFTLGIVMRETLSDKTDGIASDVGDMVDSIPIPSDIVKQAVDQATALITAATRGNIVTTATEQLIMDTKDVNTAKRVWRWNLNGLGYSDTGYNGTYATAITMDGQIVGQRIAANSISGEKLDITYKTSVTKEIADAEEAAKQDAVNYTDGQLKNYYTKSQIETSIKNTKDAVLLSAKETAEQYVDGKLKNYLSSAEIQVTTNNILQKVETKVGLNTIISSINQSAESIKIKANRLELSGYTTFSDLSTRGKTTINADNITTGSISCNRLNGGTITGQSISGGTIRGSTITGAVINGGSITGAKVNANGMEVYGDTGIGRPYLDFHMNGSGADYTARIIEQVPGRLIVYNTIASVSDKRLKKDITEIDDIYLKLFELITPKQYRFRKGNTGLSLGFIAQEMDEALDKLGVTDKPIISYPMETEPKTGGRFYAIDYNDLIAILWKKIQNLEMEIKQCNCQ